MWYMAIDPSGSYNEGKGSTGIALMYGDDMTNLTSYDIKAKHFENRHDYWKEIMSHPILLSKNITVIIETFVVRSNGFLVGKMPETSLFIGALVWELEKRNIPYVFQNPSQAKTRFKDENLGKYLTNYEIRKDKRGRNLYYLNDKQLNDHQRDAIKHLLYYKRYGEREA